MLCGPWVVTKIGSANSLAVAVVAACVLYIRPMPFSSQRTATSPASGSVFGAYGSGAYFRVVWRVVVMLTARPNWRGRSCVFPVDIRARGALGDGRFENTDQRPVHRSRPQRPGRRHYFRVSGNIT